MAAVETAPARPRDAAYPRGWAPVLAGRFLLSAAESAPDAPAVVSGQQSFTYAHLAAAAEAYRESLHAAGLRHGDAVVVQMEPSFEAVATLAACSESGCVFVPQNADTPAERVAAVCRAVDARGFVTGPAGPPLDGAAPRADVHAVASPRGLDVAQSSLSGGRRDRRTIESDTAYVVFTSGSTGEPKGIVMTHRATVAAFRAIAHCCRAHERLASCSPLGFDFCLLDMAAALGTGRTILFVPKRLALHPRRLVEFLRDEDVQQVHGVPSIWTMLLRHAADELATLRSLRRVVAAGEEFPIATVRRLRERLPALEVVNCYGQSESICCTFYDVPNPVPDDWSAVPIGSAYPGAELLLVGDDGELVDDDGVPGELYLRAASLFSGYWRSPAETERVLVPDPLAPDTSARVLRTGDIAVRGEEGFRFAGRRDLQVQIYGNRVELEEVERCVARADGVSAAAATVLEEGDAPAVVALVVASAGAADDTRIRAHCRRSLPDYMVPRRIGIVERIPLTASGKIDRATVKTLAERMASQ